MHPPFLPNLHVHCIYIYTGTCTCIDSDTDDLESTHKFTIEILTTWHNQNICSNIILTPRVLQWFLPIITYIGKSLKGENYTATLQDVY